MESVPYDQTLTTIPNLLFQVSVPWIYLLHFLSRISLHCNRLMTVLLRPERSALRIRGDRRPRLRGGRIGPFLTHKFEVGPHTFNTSRFEKTRPSWKSPKIRTSCRLTLCICSSGHSEPLAQRKELYVFRWAIRGRGYIFAPPLKGERFAEQDALEDKGMAQNRLEGGFFPLPATTCAKR